MEKINIAIVDDSSFMRRIIVDIIKDEEDMKVAFTANDGVELLKQLKNHSIDVVLLDVEMPNMNGIETLKEIIKNYKDIKVIMVSSLATTNSKITFECLNVGAFDFIIKPDRYIFTSRKFKEEICYKIRGTRDTYDNKYNTGSEASTVTSTVREPQSRYSVNKKIKAIVMGASTGGPKALQQVLSELPNNIGVPIIIVQHMPASFTKMFADRLNQCCKLTVVEAYDGQDVKDNHVYIAKGGIHLEVGSNRKLRFNDSKECCGVKPSVDILFKSAANVYKDELLSVILTGMGKDGAEGTVAVKRLRGMTMSQDEKSSAIYGMPKAAYDTGCVDAVVSLDDMANEIVSIVNVK